MRINETNYHYSIISPSPYLYLNPISKKGGGGVIPSEYGKFLFLHGITVPISQSTDSLWSTLLKSEGPLFVIVFQSALTITHRSGTAHIFCGNLKPDCLPLVGSNICIHL